MSSIVRMVSRVILRPVTALRRVDGGMGGTKTVTAAGVTMGTLGCMAPEMLTGGAVDERERISATLLRLVSSPPDAVIASGGKPDS
jgi:hypothetical protein